MVTMEENTNIVPGSSPNENAASSAKKSWADRVQEFSSNLETNNTFCDDNGTRFFGIKKSEGDFPKISQFLIQNP